ncbi:MAG: (2Fe-2S)-binding protein [Alphaproteobacteria bacterium]
MTTDKEIRLRINGRTESMTVPAHRTLLEALRGAGHVDVKCGCEKGDCGACAVLVDGIAVDSCLTLAWTAEDKEITTVAGLGTGEAPHPLQKTFMDSGAVQCGYCTPGMIVAAKSLLDRNASPSTDEIRAALSGNLCRCTGYTKIFEAVSQAADMLRREGADE